MYYIITIQKFKNTDPEASSMLGYATIQAATSACFSALASAAADDTIKSCMCLIINSEGAVQRFEKYDAPVQA